MFQVTTSIALDDLSLDQLVQLSQGIGHDIERLKAKRKHVNAKIAARLAAARHDPTPGDAQAPGVMLQTAAM